MCDDMTPNRKTILVYAITRVSYDNYITNQWPLNLCSAIKWFPIYISSGGGGGGGCGWVGLWRVDWTA